MALKDLQTKLKTVYYPSPNETPIIDRVNFGEENKSVNFNEGPFFQIGEDYSYSDKGIGKGVVDGTFRGGYKVHIDRAKIDYQRIKGYLFPTLDINLPNIDLGVNWSVIDPAFNVSVDYPDKVVEFSSPEFLTRQIGLQLMNPKISAPQGPGLIDTAPANQRTFSPVNLATQVLLSGTGVHIKREGIQPFNNRGYINNTRFAPGLLQDPTGDLLGGLLGTQKFDDTGKNNRLLYLFDEKIGDRGNERDFLNDITNTGPAAIGPRGTLTGLLGDVTDVVNTAAGFVGDTISSVLNIVGGKGEPLYDYWGGPGSMFGIGRTFIGRYTDTTVDSQGNKFPKIRPQTDGHIKDDGSYTVKNYLQSLGREFANDYDFNREQLYSLGTPGSNFGSEKYKKNPIYGKDELAIDQLNAFPIIKAEGGKFINTEIEDKQLVEGVKEVPDDFIPFRFEAIHTDNPNNSTLVVFRAFIDNLKDDYTANFNEYKYNGRAEPFYTYNSFKRSISLGFKIAAQTRNELKPLYQKLNYLTSFTAPEYSKSTGRIQTPFVRLTVGDWFKRLPGVITGVSLGWQVDYPWEINLEKETGESPAILMLPHVLDVSVSYLPIHEFLPKRSTNSPFLAIDPWLIPEDEITEFNGVEPIGGCTNDAYVEYNPQANYDDGSCTTLLQNQPGALDLPEQPTTLV